MGLYHQCSIMFAKTVTDTKGKWKGIHGTDTSVTVFNTGKDVP